MEKDPVADRNVQQPSSQQLSNEDAICFTSGPQGVFFGAGVIHAHLAADRAVPAVVAGISSGAISAAAMQRVYKELLAEKSHDGASSLHIEAVRWEWLQRYISALTDKPVNVFWDSLPNPTDFFSDENVPGLRDESLSKELQTEQMHARRQRYLLQHLGLWCAYLSIKVSRLTTAIVNFVRYKERYSGSKLSLFRNFYGSVSGIAFRLLWHTVRHPVMIQETLFDGTKAGSRPLLSWEVYLAACTTLLLLALILGGVLGFLILAGIGGVLDKLPHTLTVPPMLAKTLHNHWAGFFLTVAGFAAFVSLAAVIICKESVHGMLVRPLLAGIGFGRSILHNFPLQKRIIDIFGVEPLDSQPMPALLVVAPLQTLYRGRNKARPVSCRQLWANPDCPGNPIRLDQALVAAVALPGIWPPYSVNRALFGQWAPLPAQEQPAGEATTPEPQSGQSWTSIGKAKLRSIAVRLFASDVPTESQTSPGSQDPEPLNDTLDLVDGVAVRHNPLPALLSYLRRCPELAKRLERTNGEPSIHVVYSVPLEGPPGNGRLEERDANIVNVALVSRSLAARRDTGMEVEQLNSITRLEKEVRRATGHRNPEVTVAIADEIAPAAEPAGQADLHNPLNLQPETALRTMANGCRRTLEKLYRTDLAAIKPADGFVACRTLLTTIAPARPLTDLSFAPGLHEVCDACSQRLQAPRSPVANAPQEIAGSSLLARFPNLAVRSGPVIEGKAEARPRVVFLWSGGVFRGSFHIGMIAALLQAGIKPDLIAGASVGTLMGGTLASIFSLPEGQKRQDRLKHLVTVFREVDAQVALTRTLKEASRDLGIRGRHVDLSPRMVRNTVRRGIQADPGYAATGAPPALIDAVSSLLSIPLDQTEAIAGNFIAGLVAKATDEILSKIKEHTLKRLNIEAAVIGDSLLKQRAAELIGGSDNIDLHCDQPFTAQRIAFLATATDIGAQAQVVFGDNPAHHGRHYDFLASTLASSAFPAVFAPRRESDVLPGQGRVDIRYSDGGIFDNLPFLPAINALARVQFEESRGWDDKELRRNVGERSENPDLLVAGALNAQPETADDADGPFDYFNEINSRAARLGDNSKIQSFLDAAHFGYEQFGHLAVGVSASPATGFADRDFVRRYVNAAVLPVFPSDKTHLNPTFAFCKSTGLKPSTLARSIGDGCFQTLHTLATAPEHGSKSVRQSLTRLHETRRGEIRAIAKTSAPLPKFGKDGAQCPFFLSDGGPLTCPFAEIGQADVRSECAVDDVHTGQWGK